jgi:hypothetical protein
MSDIDITSTPDLWCEGDMASFKHTGHPSSGPIWWRPKVGWISGGTTIRWDDGKTPDWITDLRVTRPAPKERTMSTDATKLCRHSGLSLVGESARNLPNGAFLGRCECRATLVIEDGQFPFHPRGVSVVFHEWLAAHDAEVVVQIAAKVRANCTPSSEAYSKGGDTLVYAVADWIENPPEWVKAPWTVK